MSINSDIRDQAYQFFIEEAPELLQSIESGLLTLREERSTANVHNIMRAAHSLKGGSASVGLDAIKTIAHRLETIFKALYSESIEIDSELENQLLQAYDCLRLPLLEQITQGYFDSQQALESAEPILIQLEEICEDAIRETADFIPSSEDLGMSMARSIFEVDVAEGLEHLSVVLDNPQPIEVAGELRAQAEVFMGFAELLNLPGFAAIATAALAALDHYPEEAITIAQIALADFRGGRDDVLINPDSQGGVPSAALLAFSGVTIARPEDAIAELEPEQDNDWSADEAAMLLDQLGEDINRAEVLAELGFANDDLIDLMAAPSASDDIAAEASSAQLGQIFGGFDAIAPPMTPAAPTPSALTPAASTPAATPAPDAKLSRSTPGRSPQTSPKDAIAAGLTVRVEADRLNRMDNLLGELTINRNGVDLQNNQLRASVRELLNRFSRFQSAVEQMRTLSDRMLIAPERRGAQVRVASNGSTTDLGSQRGDFDSLEMDTYTQLYLQTQTLLEDIVQLEEAVEDVSLFSYQSEQLLGRHRKMLSQMQDELMWARMLPLGEILNRFPRVLRDLSNTYKKPVNLTLNGTDSLVDKAVLTKLYDPLVQLLRNSFDHGIESPELRRQRGKADIGQIEIRSRYQGRQVVIEVYDDGQGLDLERIRSRVVELGWMTTAEASAAGDAQLQRLIFEPGFSTAKQVSELSGRGIGLDIVQAQIRALSGAIAVSSSPGQGTTFTLTLPLTLSILNLLICFVGSTPLAIRSDSIQEILIPTPAQIRQVDSQRFLVWHGEEIPAYNLSNLLNYSCLLPEIPPSRVLATVPTPTNWEAPMLVLTRANQAFALQIDRLVTEQELVVKPFGTAITPPIFAYGCTVLGDGSLIPVIDGPVLLDEMVSRGLATMPQASEMDALANLVETNLAAGDRNTAGIQRLQTTTILVVDDAVTLRRTLALSLERAGYRVLQARDGQEALEQLEQSQSVELVICDVEMPNMNGFEFLTQRRENPLFAAIPVVMLTSRGNDKHRWLAMKLGAKDYFTKPYLEQELLAAIEQLLNASTMTPAPSSVGGG